ncbi:hypothetical protein BDN70DRAFT_931813 [Pholiota conissans]|uniref:Fungal ligninase C-terminal domain-containing protein n=1 Tax=Pholiota conissans TaxID=109636 RepID=A0A9P5Z3A7_9AGAR|nr:hypothetical protein BDN70DRAFT_931813 [Pholiota conissans]
MAASEISSAIEMGIKAGLFLYNLLRTFLEVLLEGTCFPGNGSQPGEVFSPLAGEMRPQPFAGSIKFPASFSNADLQLACPTLCFPNIQTVAAPAPTVAPVPGSEVANV